MSLQERLENVNEGSLLVCFCLFWWILLLGARADHVLEIPYWAVFIPLWVWKFTVFLGWFIGLVVWLRQRRAYAHSELNTTYTLDDPVFPFVQALSVSALFSLLLLCTEILLCLKLSVATLDLAYLTVLTPLLLVGLFGIFGFFFLMIDSRSFTWQRRRRNRHHARGRTLPGTGPGIRDPNTDPYDPAFVQTRPRRVCTFTLELCIAANLLQLLFLIAQLDHWIQSKWVVTFIPTFILLGMKFLFCTVGFVVALIRFFTAGFVQLEQRRLPIYYYASHLFIDFLLCTSVTLLALRLDEHLTSAQCSYLLICAPVLLSLVIYATGAFCLGPGNPWWFGLNRNVLLALFEACPSLQLCANTSVTAAGLWKRTTSGQVGGIGAGPHANGVHPATFGPVDTLSGLYSHVADDYHAMVVPSGGSAESQLVCSPPSPTRTGTRSLMVCTQRPWSQENGVNTDALDGNSGWSDACIPPISISNAVISGTAIQIGLKSSPTSCGRPPSLSRQTENVRYPD